MAVGKTIKNLLVAGVLTILIAVFFHTALGLVFDEPGDYPEHPCYDEPRTIPRDNSCFDDPVVQAQVDSDRAVFDAAEEEYGKKYFFAAIIAAVVLVVLGAWLEVSVGVAWGLMLSGVVVAFMGSVRYWEHLSQLWRLSLLGVAIAVVIYFGVRLSKKGVL